MQRHSPQLKEARHMRNWSADPMANGLICQPSACYAALHFVLGDNGPQVPDPADLRLLFRFSVFIRTTNPLVDIRHDEDASCV